MKTIEDVYGNDANIMFKLPKPLKEKIRIKAKSEGGDMSSWLRRVSIEALKK